MSQLTPFLNQFEKNIKNLLAEEHFAEAFKLCDEALKENPQEKDIIEIKKNAQIYIAKRNEKIIKEKLKELKPFEKADNYIEILKRLRELLKLNPYSEKLKRLYAKSEKKYLSSVEDLQKKFTKEESAKLDKLITENETEFLSHLFALERSNPGNQRVLQLTRAYRERLIGMKIKNKQDLIYSDKYEDIDHLIAQLKRIEKNSSQVISLEKLVKERKLGNQIAEKGEFVYQGQQYLDSLMKLKKYDKAIKLANEILSADKGNILVYKILKKAEKKFFSQTRNENVEIIQQNLPALKTDFEKNKNQFIKI